MEVRLRSWCCQLSTAVTVMAVIQTVGYLGLAISAVILVALPSSQTVQLTAWLGLSNLRLSITVLGVSFLGVLSNLILLVGIRTQSPYLLLPWLVINVLLVLAMFATGSYFVIFFTMVKKKTDLVLAAISSTPILLSMFLIIITVLVVKLFIKMKQKRLLVRVASSFRGSRASLNYKHKSTHETPKSVRSFRSVRMGHSYEQKSNIETHMNVVNNMGNRNNPGIQSYGRSRKRLTPPLSNQYARSYQLQKFTSKLDHPSYKSRSLEYILDSSTDDSLYQQQYSFNTKSLPRLKPRSTCPHGQQIGYQPSYINTDTIRSSKSVTSGKSVSIHPRVTEYRYSHDREMGVANNDGKEVFEDDDISDYSEGSVPPPIYPKQKVFSNDQIIDHYLDFIL